MPHRKDLTTQLGARRVAAAGSPRTANCRPPAMAGRLFSPPAFPQVTSWPRYAMRALTGYIAAYAALALRARPIQRPGVGFHRWGLSVLHFVDSFPLRHASGAARSILTTQLCSAGASPLLALRARPIQRKAQRRLSDSPLLSFAKGSPLLPTAQPLQHKLALQSSVLQSFGLRRLRHVSRGGPSVFGLRSSAACHTLARAAATA